MTALAVQGNPMTPVKNRPHRITFDVSADQYEWITAQRFKDRIATTMRLRALLALAMEDESLAQRVEKKVTELMRNQT